MPDKHHCSPSSKLQKNCNIHSTQEHYCKLFGLALLHEFAAEIDHRLSTGEPASLSAAPEQPYKEYRQLPVLPQSGAGCSLCGVCADECPTGAIAIGDELSTDPSCCILCMRCVAVCPSGARALPAEVLAQVTAMIQSKCNGRREAEILFN